MVILFLEMEMIIVRWNGNVTCLPSAQKCSFD